MKATRIIRRVDDLGRVVIPKGILRACGIIEGDPLEIFIDKTKKGQPMICFGKYVAKDPVSKFNNFKNVFLDKLRDSDLPYNQYCEIRDKMSEILTLLDENGIDKSPFL